jgi:hypothetical protein
MFELFCLVSRRAAAKMKEKPNQINDHSSNVPTESLTGDGEREIEIEAGPRFQV